MTDKRGQPTVKLNVNRKLRVHYWLMLLSILAGAFLYGPRLSNMPFGQWVASCLVVGVFVALPLLMFVVTTARPTPSGVSWMSFLLLGYLVYGIVLAFSPRGLVAGLMLTATSLSTFVYAILWLRPHKKAARARKKAR